MRTSPITIIKSSDFAFMSSSPDILGYLEDLGFKNSQNQWAIDITKIPNLFTYALRNETELGYHYITYKNGSQYPQERSLIVEGFYRAMPKIITAWDSYEPSMYGVTYADIWNYSLDDAFTHGHIVTTQQENTDVTAFGQTLKTNTTGTQKSVSENAPIDADIDTINTPDSKAKDSSEGQSDSTWGGTNTKSLRGGGTEENSGRDVRHEEEQRSYKNSDRARLFFENFVDAGRDIISYIHNSCKFMVYEYNIPMF